MMYLQSEFKQDKKAQKQSYSFLLHDANQKILRQACWKNDLNTNRSSLD